jgi:hypothetical protein
LSVKLQLLARKGLAAAEMLLRVLVGLSWGLQRDRLGESWVKELDGWVQQQNGDSA